VAYNFGYRVLYNLTWRAIVSSHQVQWNIPIVRPCCEKIYTTFLNDAEILTTCTFVLWRSQIVYIHPHSLNNTTAFYFVSECSDVTVIFRLRVCAYYNISVLYLALTRVGLIASCRLCMFVLHGLSRFFPKGNARGPVWTCRDSNVSDSSIQPSRFSL